MAKAFENLIVEGGDPSVPGKLAVYAGQAYVTTGMCDYVRKNGEKIRAVGLRTNCQVCDCFFDTSMPDVPAKRCETCRKDLGLVFSKPASRSRRTAVVEEQVARDEEARSDD